MASYLIPRRGKKATAETEAIVLKKGEIFFEIASTGISTGTSATACGKIKMGDGTTAYSSLGYFIDVDTSTVAFTDTATATSAAQGADYYATLNAITPSATMKVVLANLKLMVYKLATGITSLITNLGNKGYVYYGTCTTAADQQDKVATVSASQNFKLIAGATVFVKFSVNNTYNATAAAPGRLNVNSTGAKVIYWGASSAPTGTNTTLLGRANYINQYVYDGTYWVWTGSSADNNTTYTNASLGSGYGTCATAAATAAKAVTLSNYALVVGGVVAVKFTYAVPANATMNINSRGAKNIFYKGARITANVINAGDIATFIYDGTQYHLLAIDSGSAFDYDFGSLDSGF